MESEIKITGMPAAGDPERCSFLVDRPLFEGKSFYFADPEKGIGSPLVERLFAIPGIASVLVAHDTVTIVKSTPEPWPVIGKLVGAAIRETLASGAAPVSAAVLKQISPPRKCFARSSSNSSTRRSIPPWAATGDSWS